MASVCFSGCKAQEIGSLAPVNVASCARWVVSASCTIFWEHHFPVHCHVTSVAIAVGSGCSPLRQVRTIFQRGGIAPWSRWLRREISERSGDTDPACAEGRGFGHMEDAAWMHPPKSLQPQTHPQKRSLFDASCRDICDIHL